MKIPKLTVLGWTVAILVLLILSAVLFHKYL